MKFWWNFWLLNRTKGFSQFMNCNDFVYSENCQIYTIFKWWIQTAQNVIRLQISYQNSLNRWFFSIHSSIIFRTMFFIVYTFDWVLRQEIFVSFTFLTFLQFSQSGIRSRFEFFGLSTYPNLKQFHSCMQISNSLCFDNCNRLRQEIWKF